MPIAIRALVGLVFFTFTVTPCSAGAQSRATTADLRGIVTDPSGARVPGATVSAVNDRTGLTLTLTSDDAGQFRLPALAVGVYTLEASLTGFATRTLRDVVVSLGASIEVELRLGLAGSQDQVTVVGEPPGIAFGTVGVVNTITRQQIDRLPINGRNFVAFSLLTPGVATDRTPQQGASRTSGLTFAGQRARSNNVMVDGLDNNDEVVGGVRATLSQEAVQEFQVLASSYSAEFGKASGGVVNIVTRSGTNELGGNVFGFGRDDRFNAREYFERFTPSGGRIDRPKAPYGQMQFGGTLGGPLRRDRSFFFASVERSDVTASNFVTIDDRTPVPHPVMAADSLGTPAEILRRAGFPIETGNVPYSVRSTQAFARVDHRITARHSVTLRVNLADEMHGNIEPFGGTVARSRGARLDSGDRILAGAYLAVLPSGMVNELRVQVARRDQVVQSLDPSCAGACDADDEGGPTLEVTGVASVGRFRFSPTDRDNTRYQLVDTISRSAGRHNLKAGVDFSFITARDQSLPLHFGGRYIFAQQLSLPLVPGAPPTAVSAIQAVALGLPAAYVQGYGHPEDLYDYSDVSLFAQDEIRVRDRLTVRLGLRYQNQFWPATSYQVAGYPRPYGFPRDANNLAPRLSVAWDPAGDRRTSIHGGYGVYYENIITSVVGIANVINGRDGVRTLVLPAPRAFAAWSAPGHRLSEPTATALAGGTFPSVQISIDPALKTPYAHHLSIGADRDWADKVVVSANVMYVRGHKQLGTIDYNPIVAELGAVPGAGFVRRPADTGGVPGTSASVLQYTSFGDTWYRGLTLSARSRFNRRYQLFASYTVSKAEDNSTDFQSTFIPQHNGRGRDPDNLDGLPVGFDPHDERGPSLQDQRHRLVMSGLYVAPGDVVVASIVNAGSGRPYNILAGVDLNMDGNGGTFPPDRPRRELADQSTAVGRNSGTLPAFATIDVRVSRLFRLRNVTVEPMVDVFNVLNRTNYTDVQNIFGAGIYPTQPIPSFGELTQAAASRQVQIGVKLEF